MALKIPIQSLFAPLFTSLCNVASIVVVDVPQRANLNSHSRSTSGGVFLPQTPVCISQTLVPLTLSMHPLLADQQIALTVYASYYR